MEDQNVRPYDESADRTNSLTEVIVSSAIFALVCAVGWVIVHRWSSAPAHDEPQRVRAEEPRDEGSMNTFSRVKKLILEYLEANEPDVTPTASFVEDLGLKYLDPVEFILALEEEFHIEIPDEEVERNFFTVGDAVAYIDAKISSRQE
jgi:acyl carrier protein